MTDRKVPTPDEIQKEFEDFVEKKFGGSVQIMSVQQKSDEEDEDLFDGEDSIEIEEPPKTEQDLSYLSSFNYVPKEIKQHLDRYVIKQDEAKKALSIAICDHYNRIRNQVDGTYSKDKKISKQNVLLLGPTGVGKTYLIELISELIGVPFIKADATRFSETGYVGANVDDLVRDLVQKANGDIKKAECGIIYLDEADKLASPNNMMGKDISGRGVQIGLLKLMEETEIDLKSAHDMISQIQSVMDFQRKGKVEKKMINTKNILFIVSGAFSGLEEIIKKRLNLRQISLQKSKNLKKEHSDYLFSQVNTKDLTDFGFEPEFVARLPIRVGLEELTAKDLYKVLKKSEGSILNQYVDDFASYDIKLKIEDEALKTISERAAEEKTGARSLMTILEKILRDFKFELPSTPASELTITNHTLDNPKKQLEEMLRSPLIQ
jgi:endopeptidase Clp ATP-binding regulatory subunit ClpX